MHLEHAFAGCARRQRRIPAKARQLLASAGQANLRLRLGDKREAAPLSSTGTAAATMTPCSRGGLPSCAQSRADGHKVRELNDADKDSKPGSESARGASMPPRIAAPARSGSSHLRGRAVQATWHADLTETMVTPNCNMEEERVLESLARRPRAGAGSRF
jgi:hypothetical protein